MGHVEEVTVSRCGDWMYADGEVDCPGNERGCTRCHEKDPYRPYLKRYEADLLNIYGQDKYGAKIPAGVEREWADQPHPNTISHAQFLRDYGRCPDGCEVAKQLPLLETA